MKVAAMSPLIYKIKEPIDLHSVATPVYSTFPLSSPRDPQAVPLEQ